MGLKYLLELFFLMRNKFWCILGNAKTYNFWYSFRFFQNFHSDLIKVKKLL